MITLKDFFTASGKYLEREHHKEVTDTVISNAKTLLEKVNNFLSDLGIAQVFVSSGFRPSEVNNGIPNAAKKSNHCLGLAVDLADSDESLENLILQHLDLVEKHGLYLEHKDSTRGWVHIQSIPPKSGKRIFYP